MLKNLKKINLIFLLLTVVVSLPAVIGFLGNGFPVTDDGNWMIIRFSAFYEALRSGQIPVRFLLRLNNGFGYPVSDFLYPLFMYAGVPIHIIGFNFIQTIKILFSLSIIFSSFFTFLWLRKFFDNLSSFLGAFFYTFFPYHLFDIYKRGSLGEAISFPILSFVLWQLERNSLLFTSFGICLLTMSHNTLAIFFLSFVFLYGIYRNKIKKTILATVFGLGMSSFFWIPAIYDLQYTVFLKTSISDFNSYFSDNLTFSLLGLGYVFFVLHLIYKTIKIQNKKLFYLLIFTIFITFLCLSFSRPMWFLFPFTNIIQFPFRLISLIIPITAFTTAYLLNKEKKFKKYLLFSVYGFLIFASALSFIFPKNMQYFEDSYYSTNQATTTVKDEYMPNWVNQKPSFTVDKIENINGNEKINLKLFSAKKISFNTYLLSQRKIRVNVVFFPGWQAYVNGVKKDINYSDNGIMTLDLNQGENNVIIEFRENGVRLFSDYLSIISLLAVLIFVYKTKHESVV